MFFEYQGEQIHYKKTGQGNKTIVFLHGFPEDGSIFDAQLNCLQTQFQIIVPDLPGTKNSAFNDHLKTIEDFAKAIVALLQYENIKNPIILGHSMGGYIALAIEDLFPEYSAAVGLIHSTAFADSEDKKENRRKSIQLMENYGSTAFVKKALPGNFTEAFVQNNKATIASLVETASQFPTKGLQRFYEIMIERPDRTTILNTTTKPILFFIGTEDNAAPLVDLLQQVKLPQTAFIHILPNVAHMGMLEATEQINQGILKFALGFHSRFSLL